MTQNTEMRNKSPVVPITFKSEKKKKKKKKVGVRRKGEREGRKTEIRYSCLE